MPSVPTPTTPKLLQQIQWILDPVGYMNRNVQQYGDIFNATVQWGQQILTLVSEPQAIQRILTQDSGKIFSAPGEVNRSLLESFSVSIFYISGKTCILILRIFDQSDS